MYLVAIRYGETQIVCKSFCAQGAAEEEITFWLGWNDQYAAKGKLTFSAVMEFHPV